MITPRGIVYRLMPGLPPFKEWLTRSDALFASEEWGWSRHSSDAYIFPAYANASIVASELQPGFAETLVPMVKNEHAQEVPA